MSEGDEGGPSSGDPEPAAPPLYPDHCPQHADVAVPGNCGNCADVRKANERRHLSVVADVDDSRPPWCGQCNEWTRQVETSLDDGRDASRYCPNCHPLAEEAS